MNNGFLQIIGKTGDENSLEFSGECNVEQKGEDVFIRYVESEESGMTNTQTCIAFNDDIFSLTRVGDYSTSFVFEKQKEYLAEIQTPYGVMNITFFCDKLEIFKKPQKYEANLRYFIKTGDQPVKNTINLICKVY